MNCANEVASNDASTEVKGAGTSATEWEDIAAGVQARLPMLPWQSS